MTAETVPRCVYQTNRKRVQAVGQVVGLPQPGRRVFEGGGRSQCVFELLTSDKGHAGADVGVRILLPHDAEAGIGRKLRDRCIDDLVADAGGWRDQIIDQFECIAQVIELAEGIGSRREGVLIAKRKRQAVGHQRVVLFATEVAARST